MSTIALNLKKLIAFCVAKVSVVSENLFHGKSVIMFIMPHITLTQQSCQLKYFVQHVITKFGVNHLATPRSSAPSTNRLAITEPFSLAKITTTAAFDQMVSMRYNGTFLFLITTGHKSTTQKFHPKTQVVLQYLSTQDVDAFHIHFITFSTMAIEFCEHRRML